MFNFRYTCFIRTVTRIATIICNMSNYWRTAIFKEVILPLRSVNNDCKQRIMCSLWLEHNEATGTYFFKFPLRSRTYDVTNEIEELGNNNLSTNFDAVQIKDDTMSFGISRERYLKKVIESNLAGVAPPLLVNKQNVLVEFSSPNIAKPFHFGHIRSTIIGNCIANLNIFVKNKVQKINYLGDWGKQFGLIQLGMEKKSMEDIKFLANPITTLYQAYVTANELSEKDTAAMEHANNIFKRLETGEETLLQNWRLIREYTIKELEKTYERLGVQFDEYHGESMYRAGKIDKVLNLMDEMQLLTLDDKNRKVVSLNNETPVTIIKSDGSTLYIARDIAAAIDRYERYNFDRMYYIVDKGQSVHFNNLVEILSKMNLSWANSLKHVKFGKVSGMSTRKGTAIFLEDVLNEARDIMKTKISNTKTTKIELDEVAETADTLGVSGVIVEDLKQKRMNNYEFSWKNSLSLIGDSGVKLQYTHSRLSQLIHLSNGTLVTECDPSLLKETEVDELIRLISQFDEAVLKSYEELEPCRLTIYLFSLCGAINAAYKKLRVEGETNDLRNQRLLLFHVARITLAEGMKLLGLKPLNRM